MIVISLLVLVTVCVILFFFFKQKTAYEMRISDWSSDVCSSDLTFRAKNDVFQFNAEFSVSPEINLYSQTSYSRDNYNSTQDYNRFNPGPVFLDTAGLTDFFTGNPLPTDGIRSEEHTSELQSLMRISYAVFCLKKQTQYKEKI